MPTSSFILFCTIVWFSSTSLSFRSFDLCCHLFLLQSSYCVTVFPHPLTSAPWQKHIFSFLIISLNSTLGFRCHYSHTNSKYLLLLSHSSHRIFETIYHKIKRLTLKLNSLLFPKANFLPSKLPAVTIAILSLPI